MKYVTKQPEYRLKSRWIAGTHQEKLEQIDAAMQELFDLKLLDCAPEHPNVRFVAVPPRRHPLAMALTIVTLGFRICARARDRVTVARLVKL